MGMRLSACVIVKDEGLYLKEWLEFNLLQGFTKHYIYNDNSSDDTMDVLAPYIAAGSVEMIDARLDSPILFAAYQTCIEQHLGGETWLAFIDVDEFLWSPCFPTALAALDSLPLSWGAVGVNWMMFNGSGKQQWEDRPVIERFTWRPAADFSANRHIKSIIRMNQQVHVGGDPHFFQVERGTYNELGEQLAGPLTSAPSSDLLRINHYFTKSFEECEARARKGQADRAGGFNLNRWYGVSQELDVDERGPGSIQKFLPELKRRLGK